MKHRCIITIVLAVAASLAGGTSGAQVVSDFEEGARTYPVGDDATAYRNFKLSAGELDGLNEPDELDDLQVAKVQVALARMYLKGLGVPKNYARAMKWFRRAAAQGDARAQFHLGLMYDVGLGVPENSTEAVKWFHRAAEQGDARAQSHLGVMYAGGLGVPEDYAEAVKWFHRAAAQGDARAQLNLGVLYGIGRGVPRDDVQAYRWIILAGAQGEVVKTSKNVLQKRMIRAQISEAQKLARDFQPKKERRAH